MPVAVEFVVVDHPDRKHAYLLGSTVEAVMKDTAGGKAFGFYTFCGHRVISIEEARKLADSDKMLVTSFRSQKVLNEFDYGLESVTNKDDQNSFFVGFSKL